VHSTLNVYVMNILFNIKYLCNDYSFTLYQRMT